MDTLDVDPYGALGHRHHNSRQWFLNHISFEPNLLNGAINIEDGARVTVTMKFRARRFGDLSQNSRIIAQNIAKLMARTDDYYEAQQYFKELNACNL